MVLDYRRFVRTVLAGAGMLALSTAAMAQTAPTFTRDIAPIFQDKCEACHRPDSITPMSLLTYEEVRPWARAIKERTLLHNAHDSIPP